jgi:hypothetical protein
LRTSTKAGTWNARTAEQPGQAPGAACQVKVLPAGASRARPPRVCQAQARAAMAVGAPAGPPRSGGSEAPDLSRRRRMTLRPVVRLPVVHLPVVRLPVVHLPVVHLPVVRLLAAAPPSAGQRSATRCRSAPRGRLATVSLCSAAFPPPPACQRRGGERSGSRLPAARKGCPPHPSHGPGTRHARSDQRHRRALWQGGGLVEGGLGPDGRSGPSPGAPTWSLSAAAQCWQQRRTRHSRPIGSGS